MGEAVLRDRLARRGVDAHVHSAGLMEGGAPADATSARAMARRGYDLSAHVSTALSPELVERADLVIGMAREHVREAALMADGALARTFTLKELVRRAEVVGPRPWRGGGGSAASRAPGDEPFDRWLHVVGQGRRATDLLGSAPDDDVEDPIGRSRRHHDRVAAEIERLVDAFVALAFPTGAPATP